METLHYLIALRDEDRIHPGSQRKLVILSLDSLREKAYPCRLYASEEALAQQFIQQSKRILRAKTAEGVPKQVGLCPLEPRRHGKLIIKDGPQVKLADIMLVLLPTTKRKDSRPQTDYELVRASERRARRLLECETVVYGITHAATRQKPQRQVPQKRHVNLNRTNTEKRQLYGAPVRRK